ncbi:hypothetical protein JXA63_00550 [Candidatus Woesebacteria bacterium]|nr:hypothetical protein [Candidatus Woesebacteria bacterium]
MDKNNKQILRELIRELNMAMTPEEIEENLSHLNEEEAGLLVKKYSAIKKYRDALEEYASIVNPEEYKKAMTEYNKKLHELESQYSADMEEIQEQEDGEMEKIERQATEELEKASEDMQKDIDTILEVNKEVDKKLEVLANSETNQ